MSNCRDPLHCILPGFILRRMADSPNKKVRQFAIDNIGPSSGMRAVRKKVSSMQFFAAIPSPAGRKYRLIYDGGQSMQGRILVFRCAWDGIVSAAS
jgi:hypothetical protein